MSNTRKRANYFDTTAQSKKRNRRVIISKLEDASRFSDSIDLEIGKIYMNRKSINPRVLTEKDLIISYVNQEPVSISFLEKKFLCLRMKDNQNMSKRKYINLRKELTWIDIPSYKAVLSVQKSLNSFFEIKTNTKGAYLNIRKKIEFCCKKFVESMSEEIDVFVIKLSGDGTFISKKGVNVFNFTFTIINDTKKASKGTICWVK